MKVEIKTLYLGGCFYRVGVIKDGEVAQTYGATVGTVGPVRNRLCQYWSQVADEVIADEIPKATDVITKGQTYEDLG